MHSNDNILRYLSKEFVKNKSRKYTINMNKLADFFLSNKDWKNLILTSLFIIKEDDKIFSHVSNNSKKKCFVYFLCFILKKKIY